MTMRPLKTINNNQNLLTRIGTILFQLEKELDVYKERINSLINIEEANIIAMEQKQQSLSLLGSLFDAIRNFHAVQSEMTSADDVAPLLEKELENFDYPKHLPSGDSLESITLLLSSYCYKYENYSLDDVNCARRSNAASFMHMLHSFIQLREIQRQQQKRDILAESTSVLKTHYLNEIHKELQIAKQSELIQDSYSEENLTKLCDNYRNNEYMQLTINKYQAMTKIESAFTDKTKSVDDQIKKFQSVVKENKYILNKSRDKETTIFMQIIDRVLGSISKAAFTLFGKKIPPSRPTTANQFIHESKRIMARA